MAVSQMMLFVIWGHVTKPSVHLQIARHTQKILFAYMHRSPVKLLPEKLLSFHKCQQWPLPATFMATHFHFCPKVVLYWSKVKCHSFYWRAVLASNLTNLPSGSLPSVEWLGRRESGYVTFLSLSHRALWPYSLGTYGFFTCSRKVQWLSIKTNLNWCIISSWWEWGHRTGWAYWQALACPVVWSSLHKDCGVVSALQWGNSGTERLSYLHEDTESRSEQAVWL